MQKAQQVADQLDNYKKARLKLVKNKPQDIANNPKAKRVVLKKDK